MHVFWSNWFGFLPIFSSLSVYRRNENESKLSMKWKRWKKRASTNTINALFGITNLRNNLTTACDFNSSEMPKNKLLGIETKHELYPILWRFHFRNDSASPFFRKWSLRYNEMNNCSTSWFMIFIDWNNFSRGFFIVLLFACLFKLLYSQTITIYCRLCTKRHRNGWIFHVPSKYLAILHTTRRLSTIF